MVARDAFGIVACEICSIADRVLAGLGLVRAITAVILMVTLPLGVDAAPIVTLELIFCVALFPCDGAVGHFGCLISTINAIRVTIAHPLLGYAHGSPIVLVGLAFKLGLRVTCALGTVLQSANKTKSADVLVLPQQLIVTTFCIKVTQPLMINQ